MKRLFIAIGIAALIIALDTEAECQVVFTYEVSVTLTPGQQDTLWWPMRPALGEPFVAPTTASTVNPPDFATWAGNLRFYVRRTSGTTADSLLTLGKTADRSGNIFVSSDTSWIFGTSFTSITPNTFGDGRTHSKPLSATFAPSTSLVFILKLSDLVGGSRTFTFGLESQ